MGAPSRRPGGGLSCGGRTVRRRDILALATIAVSGLLLTSLLYQSIMISLAASSSGAEESESMSHVLFSAMRESEEAKVSREERSEPDDESLEETMTSSISDAESTINAQPIIPGTRMTGELSRDSQKNESQLPNTTSDQAGLTLLAKAEQTEPKQPTATPFQSGTHGKFTAGAESDATIPKRSTSIRENHRTIEGFTDPTRTPRLRHLANLTDFPVPQFHGCSHSLCMYSNVCYSAVDGVLVFDVPGLVLWRNSSEYDLSRIPNSTDLRRHWKEVGTIARTRLPKLVPRSTYPTFQKVYWTDGKIFAMNCWRQSVDKKNPVHMLMGHGKLFSYTNERSHRNATASKSVETVDMLLYHQCSSNADWDWGRFVEALIWKNAVSKGVVLPPERDSKIVLPFKETRRGEEKQPSADDTIVCGATVFQRPFAVDKFLDTNSAELIADWRKELGKHLQERNISVSDASLPRAKIKTSLASCARGLQIAAWNRTEGPTLRQIQNMEDVRRLALEFSDKPLVLLSANSSTPLEDQVTTFRSFDILISTHGAQLANMVFSKQMQAIIEVFGVFVHDCNKHNGRAFLASYRGSFGHFPVNNTGLTAAMHQCRARNRSMEDCRLRAKTRVKFRGSDYFVNITRLRMDLEETISELCKEDINRIF